MITIKQTLLIAGVCLLSYSSLNAASDAVCSGVWEISLPEQAEGPQVIPVELPWRCIKMHTDPGGLLLDPFCGGGTTLIAAEQSGRRCFAMDSDPVSCDLAILRWEQFTGEKAVRLEK